jgi:sulfatase modifying factor 1
VNRAAGAILLMTILGTGSCGDGRHGSVPVQPEEKSESPSSEPSALDLPSGPVELAPIPPRVPAWAKVAPEQVIEAEKHGVPVAFTNRIGMRFVLIPAGTFLMGSPEDEAGRADNETLREVTLTKPIYMQVTEVTNGDYRRFDPDHYIPFTQIGAKAMRLDGYNQPVVMTTWEDAQRFAAWLGKIDPEHTYRLPTEAEWERAARAGSRGPRFFGTDRSALPSYVNFGDKHLPTGPQDLDDGYAVSAPVGSYRPNPWGLHDMLGNVHERCQDWYSDMLIAGPVVDPAGPDFGERHVLRGSAWYDEPSRVRVARRFGLHASVRQRNIADGFRLVSPLPER